MVNMSLESNPPGPWDVHGLSPKPDDEAVIGELAGLVSVFRDRALSMGIPTLAPPAFSPPLRNRPHVFHP